MYAIRSYYGERSIDNFVEVLLKHLGNGKGDIGRNDLAFVNSDVITGLKGGDSRCIR